MRFAPGCFCSLHFLGVSLGPSSAKSQKMRDLGVLAKFAIARLYGHFWSRGLQQNFFLCLHFKCILIRRWCDLRQGVFVAYILEEFPLVPLLRNTERLVTFSQKTNEKRKEEIENSTSTRSRSRVPIIADLFASHCANQIVMGRENND